MNLKYAFGAKLPLEVEVVLMIVSDAPASQPGRESQLRTSVINGFTTSLINLWTKAFGGEYIQPRSVVQKKLRKLLNTYHNEYYVLSVGSKKRKTELLGKSKRQLFRAWAENHMGLFDILRKTANPDNFDKDERIFYYNQKGNRAGTITNQVDETYNNPLLRPEDDSDEEEEATATASEDEEDDTVVDMDIESSITEIMNVSANRSGLIRIVPADDQITGSIQYPRPEIRRERVLTEKIKTTCARVAVGTQCSAMYARKAVQIVARELYGHEYYLTAEEQMEHEPELAEGEVATEDIDDEEESNMPHNSQQWKRFKYVLPHENTITKYIGLLAASEEAEAGMSLFHMPEDVKSTLHYDATSRNFIDGDWVTLTLKFSNDVEHDLRPLFMSVETRENIINLIEETLKRVALASSIESKVEITAKMLWEKITYLSTDAVSKNHFIGEGVAEKLNSSHVPIHVLCKSHTVEGLDRTSLKVLTNSIEIPLNLRGEMEKINPNLRSFFRNNTVVQAGMTALLKIVTPDTSANSCSLSVPFERLCIQHGWSRKLQLYRERRFCKLGSCANAIIQALPIFEQLLEETPADNLLAQACRIYLKCEVFISELRLLAYFNFHVAFPFLHAVEKLTTPDLKKLLPRLHQDLLQGKVNTLELHKVKSKIGNVDELRGDLEKRMMTKLAKAAAVCIQVQCGREYGFAADPNEELRAADLTKIPDEELLFAPTNNLIAERKLSVFSRRSRTAVCKNSQHTGELLRDNMMLHSAGRTDISKRASVIRKELAAMNVLWYTSQKKVQQQAMEVKLSKKRQHVDYVLSLAKACKSWGGPCCSAEELREILKKNGDIDKKIVKAELSFYVHTHKADRANRPELYKLSNIDMPTQLENLSILLSNVDNNASISSVAEVSLPTNDDALKVLSENIKDREHDVYEANMLCISVWYEGDDVTWHLGYFSSMLDEENFIVEQLVRAEKGSDLMWVHPQLPLMDKVHKDQVLRSKNGKRFQVKGSWNYERKNKFTLKNKDEVIKEFTLFKAKF